MDWLIIIGLAGWVWWQARRIGALQRRVSDLELKIAKPAAAAQPAPTVSASAPAPEPLPLELDHLLAAEEPLLLDTPVPAPSNDETIAAPQSLPDHPAESRPPLLLTETAPPAAASPPPPSAKPDRRFEQWLSENGLAWLGAAALALAGISLVSYAAQQNWFTPPVRLFSALILGGALIGASEWVRRRAQNALVAALLAGAGAAIFYATAWAAHGLYHLVDTPMAAALLTLCAILLVALSFVHGEALALLAIVAAFLAPPLTSLMVWPSAAITLYVAAVALSGFVLAYFRRWSFATVATLAGCYFWFAAAIDLNEIRRALALLSIASVGGVMLATRPALANEAAAPWQWSQTRQLAPTVAVCIASVLLIWAWLAIAASPSGRVAGPALIAVFHVALAAYAVRGRVAAPAALAVSIGALVLGFAVYLVTRTSYGAPGYDFYPTILFGAFTVAASAIGARAHRTARGLTAGAGAIGAGLLTLLSATSRLDWHAPQAWAPLFAGALLLFAAAWRASQDIADPTKDRAVDLWTGAAAALALIGIESAFPAAPRTIADAVAALGFSAAFASRGWRMLRFAALTAAAIAVAHALAPDLIGATLAGVIPLWRALLYLAATAAALFAAGLVAARQARRSPTAEALNSASLLVVLIGVFLGLQWIAAGGAGAPLDDFTETALRALTLIAAGHITLPRASENVGIIARWRGHVLMSAGLLYAFTALGLGENPWWGAFPAQIEGPPLLNGLLLAFGAPAALALAAANRLYRSARSPARAYAVAGIAFAVLWLVLEVRRGCHGAAMAVSSVGVFEGACYGMIALAVALAIAAIPRLRAQNSERPFTQDLARAASAASWAGMAIAVFLMLVEHHPWWGVQDPATTSALSTGLGVVSQMWAATLALGLGRALSRKRGVDATRFAAAATAALFALSFGHVTIRWLFHGGDMDSGAALAPLEGVGYALWPLVLVLGASAITERAPGRDAVRAYLYDLEAIWSVAIWPSLVFAALGLWLWFNPWWGGARAATPALPAVLLVLCAYPVAAALSAMAPRVAHAAFATWIARTAIIAAAGHLFVGATLIVRTAFRGVDIAFAPTTEIEMWSYSAVWAVFGAVVLAIGAWRDNAVLRWIGLAILCVTALKVFTVDSARLSVIIRGLSFLGFGVVAILVALGMRRFRQTPPPGPGDVLKVIPSARRDRRNARR